MTDSPYVTQRNDELRKIQMIIEAEPGPKPECDLEEVWNDEVSLCEAPQGRSWNPVENEKRGEKLYLLFSCCSR